MDNPVLDRDNIPAGEPASTAELVKGETASLATSASAGSGHEPLFASNEADSFRSRWHDVQGSFVDEPRRAVEQADQLVASVIKRLAEVFADERNRMEHEWSKGQDVSTEDLRQALRRYRSFFDRLLSV